MKQQMIPQEIIEKKIFLIKGQKVMLDRDLAELYGVETRILNQAVKRNIDRFPKDFMFILTREEIMRISQFVISLKFSKNVYAFTEQGVAMLSSVLNSKKSVQVNIGIMRVFVNIRKIASSNKEIINRLNQLEKKVELHDATIKTIFDVIHKPMLVSETALISPEKPFTNRKIFWNIIKSCSKHIYWIDKYFSKAGFELLSESLNFKNVEKIYILMSVDKISENLRNIYKNFKKELNSKNITCELRVLTDKKVISSIHDRWIISKNVCYNVPSTDTILRGQYSEIKKTSNKPPFIEWWKKSKDIITEWNEINKSIKTK